jgi:aspartyl-tRNA(Asn)/glutamyl-tRNA(Gln) amidotransferase subunit C
MSLTQQEVLHIAKLARLSLTPEEVERYRAQLSAILEHVAQLQRLDTSAVAPLTSMGAESRLRPDEPRPGLPPATLLNLSAQQQDKQFRIPPVFEP